VAIGRCCALLSVQACPNSFKGAKFYSKDTLKHAEAFAEQLSSPQIMYQAQLRTGEKIIVDDYYRGYQWVDANTPKDSRVMAWWDYGYQITGIANRTSIADGNTWNHEHIATLGYMLTSPEKRAHKYIRHMADYVLVWAGGRGDDMGKSPHLARIANSVFPDHCGDADPRCHNFGFYQGGEPTPMMEKSLLYKLVKNGEGRASVDTSLFQEVHTTRHGFMRIYKVLNVSQKSKRWCADPANRKCDAPGSWYCEGQYPPSIDPLIKRRRNFAQLEDFNKKGGAKSAYTKLIEDERAREKTEDAEKKKKKKQKKNAEL
jgi:dolichyl-diphosphooligosaccharide--protein glycosyltransferase